MFTLLLYFRSNIHGKKSGRAAGLICIEFAIVAAVILSLQVFFAVDIMKAMPIVNLIMLVNAAVLAVLLVFEMKASKKAKAFLLSWIPLFVMVLVDILDLFIHFPGSHYFRIGLAVTMIYQLIVLMRDLKRQYKEAIRYQQVQKELYEAKVAVMASQIRPHFMYNALTSIAMMCQIDPEKAQEATVTFAKYLRGNMDSLKQTKPVPFETELEHLKKYLYIEKLNIEYDIQATDFKLPMLSVQPLVENAVKHGVGMKKKGGTVTIISRETDSAFEVIVKDDGVGFDMNAPKKDDGRSHVGMENTRTRLKEMCGADMPCTYN